MDLIELRVAATVLSLTVFLGILAWAYAGPQRRRFEDDADIPFLEDQPPGARHARAAAHRPAVSLRIPPHATGRKGQP